MLKVSISCWLIPFSPQRFIPRWRMMNSSERPGQIWCLFSSVALDDSLYLRTFPWEDLMMLLSWLVHEGRGKHRRPKTTDTQWSRGGDMATHRVESEMGSHILGREGKAERRLPNFANVNPCLGWWKHRFGKSGTGWYPHYTRYCGFSGEHCWSGIRSELPCCQERSERSDPNFLTPELSRELFSGGLALEALWALLFLVLTSVQAKISSVRVSNDGWDIVPVDYTDKMFREEIRIRGFELDRLGQQAIFFDEPGDGCIRNVSM